MTVSSWLLLLFVTAGYPLEAVAQADRNMERTWVISAEVLRE